MVQRRYSRMVYERLPLIMRFVVFFIFTTHLSWQAASPFRSRCSSKTGGALFVGPSIANVARYCTAVHHHAPIRYAKPAQWQRPGHDALVRDERSTRSIKEEHEACSSRDDTDEKTLKDVSAP